MKRLSFLIALMIVLNWSGPARAETSLYEQCKGPDPTMVAAGITYNLYRKMDEIERGNYVNSWLYGFNTGISFFYVACGERIGVCHFSTSRDQRAAMLEKEAKVNPQIWGSSHSTTWYMFKSFVEPCLKGDIPLKKKK